MKKIIVFISVIVGVLCFGAPVKSFLASRETMGIEAASMKPTAADYIQDGLVAMWDIIETGGRDIVTDGWLDIIGGRIIPCNSSNVEVELDGGLRFFNSVSLGYDDLPSLPDISIECVCHSSYRKSTYDKDVAFRFNTFQVCINRAQSDHGGRVSVTSSDLKVRNFWMTNPDWKSYMDAYATWTGTMTGGHGGRKTVYFNANSTLFPVTQSSFYTSSIVSYSSSFGVTGNLNIMPLYCKHIRAYNRVLNQDEIDYNHQIDKARFNLPE